MRELAQDKFVQYAFVQKLLAQKERVIARTIEDSLLGDQEKVAEAQRYREYLVMHVKLMCDKDIGDADKAHWFVKKEYYPIAPCLEICKEAKADMAVAVLHLRNCEHMQSLTCYLGILDSLDVLEMMKELHILQKAQPIPYALHQPLVRLEFLSLLGGSPTLHRFDELLHEVQEIALVYEQLLGETAWFRILDFLANFLLKIPSRLEQRLAGKRPDDFQQRAQRVTDFVEQRKVMLLKCLPDSISLQRLTEKLQLEVKDINAIFDYKIHDYRENRKYMRLAKKHQEKELAAVLRTYLQDVVNTFLSFFVSATGWL